MKILSDLKMYARFGGGPFDYQLLEEEDPDGFTRLSLLVNPTLGKMDEGEIIETALKSLGLRSVSADSARAIWHQAKTLRVKRIPPIYSDRGKLLPLHLSKNLYSVSKKKA